MRDVDEVRRVQWVQRKREGKGRFRGDLASECARLVHILPEVRNDQDCATHATTREKTPPSGAPLDAERKLHQMRMVEETGVIDKKSPPADEGCGLCG